MYHAQTYRDTWFLKLLILVEVLIMHLLYSLETYQLVGGYAQISYHFNYYGPIGNQRDEYVAVRK